MSDLTTRSQQPDFSDTLEAHGVRWRFNFLADVPDEDGNLRDYRLEPKWAEKDLTPDQRAELEGWIAEHLAARPQDGLASARWGLMERNGVECSHLHGRRPIVEKVPSAGYECLTCRSMIVPKVRPETFRFVGGPLDGYYLATNGAPTWRVVDPPPLTALDTGPVIDMPVIEYERRGNVYVLQPTPQEGPGRTLPTITSPVPEPGSTTDAQAPGSRLTGTQVRGLELRDAPPAGTPHHARPG